MFKPRTQFKICKILKSETGRVLMVKLEISDVQLVIGNIYAPNTDCPECCDNVFVQNVSIMCLICLKL